MVKRGAVHVGWHVCTNSAFTLLRREAMLFSLHVSHQSSVIAQLPSAEKYVRI